MSTAPAEGLHPGQGRLDREIAIPVDGPLLPLVLREAGNPTGLRTILANDVRSRGLVKEPFQWEAPFILYTGMNGDEPDSAVGVATLETAISELRLERTRIVLVGLASSGAWLGDERVVGRLRRPDLVTVLPTTKNPETAQSWRANGSLVAEIPVSPYVGGRSNGNYSDRVPVYVRDPHFMIGAVVLGADDAIAQAKSAEDLLAGVQPWRPKEFNFVAILSKWVQGGAERLRRTPGVSGVVEAIPVERVFGPGGGENIIIGSPIRKEYQEGVS